MLQMAYHRGIQVKILSIHPIILHNLFTGTDSIPQLRQQIVSSLQYPDVLSMYYFTIELMLISPSPYFQDMGLDEFDSPLIHRTRFVSSYPGAVPKPGVFTISDLQ